MKNQIEKLIELAGEYHKYAMDNNFPMSHNYIRESIVEDNKITIWLSEKGASWCVYFGRVVIRNYSSMIDLPYDADRRMLLYIYNDAYQFLHKELLIVPEYTMEELIEKLGNFKFKK